MGKESRLRTTGVKSIFRDHRPMLCLAKITNAFEMNDMGGVRVTCYMERHSVVKEFWRTTGVSGGAASR